MRGVLCRLFTDSPIVHQPSPGPWAPPRRASSGPAGPPCCCPGTGRRSGTPQWCAPARRPPPSAGSCRRRRLVGMNPRPGVLGPRWAREVGVGTHPCAPPRKVLNGGFGPLPPCQEGEKKLAQSVIKFGVLKKKPKVPFLCTIRKKSSQKNYPEANQKLLKNSDSLAFNLYKTFNQVWKLQKSSSQWCRRSTLTVTTPLMSAAHAKPGTGGNLVVSNVPGTV